MPLAFRCAYCGFFNPAKKVKPGATIQVTQQSPIGNQPPTESSTRSSSRQGSQTNLAEASSRSNSNGDLTVENQDSK